MPFQCQCCGEIHDEDELSFGIGAPDYYQGLPDTIRDLATLTDDVCVVSNEHFFVCGRLEIPIMGTAKHFGWTTWVSLSANNFARMIDLWTKTGRESEPPYFGWFSNRLPEYPDTLNLKVNLHTQPVGMRPLIELEPTDHPLAIDQRVGISQERAWELGQKLLHRIDGGILPIPRSKHMKGSIKFVRSRLLP